MIEYAISKLDNSRPYVNIYIYIYRERERYTYTYTYVYIYIYIYIYYVIYIYIYIYTHTHTHVMSKKCARGSAFLHRPRKGDAEKRSLLSGLKVISK